MQVKIILHGPLYKYSPGENPFFLDIAPGSTLCDVLEEFGLPRTSFSIITVDGVKCGPEHPFNGGELIKIYPPVAGG